VQFDVCKLGGAVDRHERVELTLFSPHFSDVDVEEADRVTLELLLCWSVAFADAMTLQAAMQ
jgi:hypothetical protein